MFDFQPVVIIGAPRSGTNLLRDILISIDGFVTWPCDEINYIWRYGNASYPSDVLTQELATPKTRKYIRRQFKSLSAGMKGKYIVEKTCANSLRVDFINKILPEAKYIFIYRDGLDASASAMKRWSGKLNIPYIYAKSKYVPLADIPYYASKYFINRIKKIVSKEKRLASWGPTLDNMQLLLNTHDLEELCALQWRQCVESALMAFDHIGLKNVHRVRYEDFVKNPMMELKLILEFLGEKDSDIEPNIVANVSVESIGKGRAELGEDGVKKLEYILNSTLRKLGYA